MRYDKNALKVDLMNFLSSKINYDDSALFELININDNPSLSDLVAIALKYGFDLKKYIPKDTDKKEFYSYMKNGRK